jgi:uncharacterized protein
MAANTTSQSCTLLIKVIPNASRSSIEVTPDGLIRIKITTPPVEGRANKAVIKLLAKALGLPPSALHITRGESSREKLIEIKGLDEPSVRAVLAGE